MAGAGRGLQLFWLRCGLVAALSLSFGTAVAQTGDQPLSAQERTEAARAALGLPVTGVVGPDGEVIVSAPLAPIADSREAFEAAGAAAPASEASSEGFANARIQRQAIDANNEMDSFAAALLQPDGSVNNPYYDCGRQSTTIGRGTGTGTEMAEVYTCQSGIPVLEQNDNIRCNLQRSVTVDGQWQYICRKQFDPVTRTFPSNPRCDAVGAAPQCAKSGGEICEVARNVPPVSVTCDVGVTLGVRNEGCSATYVGIGTRDVEYRCIRTYNRTTRAWEDSAACVATAGCQTAGRGCTQTPGPYTQPRTCEIGSTITRATQTCLNDRVVVVDEDYGYRGERVWNGSAHVPNAAFTTLNQQPANCSKLSESCATASPGVFGDWECETGFRMVDDLRTCVWNNVPDFDTDFLYVATRGWNGSAWQDASARVTLRGQGSQCSQTGESCTRASPGVFSDYVCQSGYRDFQDAKTCTYRNVPDFDTDYFYDGERSWTGGAFAKNAAYTTLENQGANCSSQSETCVQGSPGVFADYQCETGYRMVGDPKTCVFNYVPDFDTDYFFNATRSWNGSSFVNSAALDSLGNSGGDCVRQSQTCTRGSPGVFSNYVCQDGYREVSLSRVCERKYVPDFDTDYFYKTRRTWNGSTHASDGAGLAVRASGGNCLAQGSTCVEGSGGAWTSYSCQLGYSIATSAQTCSIALTIGTRSAHQWTCRGMERMTRTGEPIFASCSDLAMNGCQLVALNGGPKESGVYYCPSDNITGFYWSDLTPIMTYNGVVNLPGPASEDATPCNTLQAQCSYNGRVCAEGPETRSINGVAVYQACWRWTASYSCPTQNNAQGCSPPSGSRLVSESCAWSDSGGVCRLFNRNYEVPATDPTGGCRVFEDNWRCEAEVAGVAISSTVTDHIGSHWENDSPECGLVAAGGCPLVSNTALEGAGTRVVNGVSVYQSVWRERNTHDCTGRQNAPGCCPPANAGTRSSRCLWSDTGGTCRLWEHSYPIPQADPSGGCHEYTSHWRCENQRPGLSPASTVTEHIGSHWEWDGAYGNQASCQAIASQGCPFSNQLVNEGAGTRTINGVSVTQSVWKATNNHACQRREDAAGCSPPANAQSPATTCLWTDAGGVCRLERRVYKVPQADPSGGCHRYSSRWRCEDAVGGLTAAGSVTDHVGQHWEADGGDCGFVSGNSACTAGAWTTVEGAGTRIVNGIAVTLPEWRGSRAFSCIRRENAPGCSPPAGATGPSAVCLWSDSGGTCRLFSNSYQVPQVDPSGGCHEYTSNWRCEDRVGGLVEIGTVTDHVGQHWEAQGGDCGHVSANLCPQTSVTATQGAGTRTVNGVAVTLPVWQEQRSYMCQKRQDAPACTPPAGATGPKSETCLWSDSGGTCRLFKRVYSIPLTDPSGGCHVYRAEFRCETAVGGLTPYTSWRDVVSESWTTTCSALSATAGCSKTATDVTVAAQDRMINGLVVSRDPWQTRDTYSCDTSTGVDTCTGNVNQCTERSRTCSGTNPANGQCVKWQVTYDCPADDGSGGCAVETVRRVCDAPVNGAGTPVRTITQPGGVERVPGTCAAAANTHCRLKSTRCTDASPARRTPPRARLTWRNGEPWEDVSNDTLAQWETACWAEENIYECTTETPVAQPCGSQVATCTVSSSTCAERRSDGTCAREQRIYSCPGNDGSGGCEVKRQDYVCSAPVEGHNADQVTITGQTVTVDDSACRRATDGMSCQETSRSCVDGPSTRVIKGITVGPYCWNEEVVYSCMRTGAEMSDCQVPAGCTFDRSECLAEDANRRCTLTEHVYRCTGGGTTGGTAPPTTGTCGQVSACVNGNCVSQTEEENESLEQGLAGFMLAARSHAEMTINSSTLEIFKGQPLGCTKWPLGVRNCCSNDGILVPLIGCPNAARLLAESIRKKQAHYLGSFCSKKHWTGICVETRKVYCAFGSQMGRMVHETGRPQIGLEWGGPKSPQCRGFTPEELERLDLENMDVSELLSGALDGLEIGSPSMSGEDIAARIQSFYNSGGTGPTTPAPGGGGP